MEIEQLLHLQALQNRVAFEQPKPEPVAYVVDFDAASEKYVVQRGADRIFVDSNQVTGVAIGQRVDLNGKRIDYL